MPLKMLLLMDPRWSKLMLHYNLPVRVCVYGLYTECAWIIPAGTKVGTHTSRRRRNLEFAPGTRMDATEDDG